MANRWQCGCWAPVGAKLLGELLCLGRIVEEYKLPDPDLLSPANLLEVL